MVVELKEILIKEKQVIDEMITLLEKQHELIVNEKAFALESIIDEIEEANKNIAIIEMQRRKLCKDKKITEVISEVKDKELEKCYDDCIMSLEIATMQKDTNSLLLRQALVYTNSMINMMKPQEKAYSNTYNSYGKVRR